MRPNSRYQQSLVTWRFRGDNVIVFSIPKGKPHRLTRTTWVRIRILTIMEDTNLPEDLLLVHERTDHYSLQPAVRMSLDSTYLHLLNAANPKLTLRL